MSIDDYIRDGYIIVPLDKYLQNLDISHWIWESDEKIISRKKEYAVLQASSQDFLEDPSIALEALDANHILNHEERIFIEVENPLLVYIPVYDTGKGWRATGNLYLDKKEALKRLTSLPYKRKTVHVTLSMHNKLSQVAQQNGQAIEFVVKKAVKEYIKKMEKKHG